MKLIRERSVGEGGGGGECDGGGEVVVVGVKFDAQSKELLTWTLMKVAQPGYRIIALHVLHSASEFASGTSSLLSLVKAFDSLLAVYEGFCNLKQVDLKLKMCRGSSVKKILVREAKASGASKVVVGASKSQLGIRSSASLAKHCAKKLAKSVSVIAVSNGKIVFQREASLTDIASLGNSGRDTHSCSSRSSDSVNCVNHLASEGISTTELLEQSQGDENVDNSLALVPFQSNVVGSNVSSNVAEGLPESKQGWSFVRRVFLPKKGQPERSQAKRTSLVRWMWRFPARNSSSVVYPDQKQSVSQVDEDCCSNLDSENGAIVLVGPEVSWSPVSPAAGSNDLPEELKGLHEKFSSLCRFFSYEELLLATSNFAPENMVGKGGSSHVYKGCLPDGKELAVKILKPSEDVLKEFSTEIEIITTLCHKNIISLFGFCSEHNNLLLVYDFLQGGSLEENLHGFKKDETAFGWHERYKVALGVAEALDFLHNGSDKPVIHKDVKSSNILLSSDFEPQLSDFGLAMWASSSSSQVTYTDVAGTFGYLAPEYFMHGKVSDKVDVFAFGVVLLELLSGRMPINKEKQKGSESLVLWAKPILKDGKVSELLDPRIGTEYDSDQIELMVLAATLCTRHSPKTRPQISIVLKLLQGDEEVKEWARREVKIATEVDAMDGGAIPTNIQSHLNLALLELDDDSCSFSSTEQGVSLEDYLQGRWSRTSSSLTSHVCSE